MRPALVRVDVVGEAEHGLLVGRVPLHRDLDRALVAVALEEDDLLADRVLVLVEVPDEVLDAALVLERRLLALGAVILDADLQPAREERGLAQALFEDREVELGDLEDLRVRQEVDGGARLLRGLTLLERSLRDPPHVGLPMDEAIALDGDLEALRQRVHHRDADAVETARHLVTAALAELAASVEHGEHDLDRGLALLLHDRDRNATAVVGHGDRVVGMDLDLDLVAVPGKGLVNRVVHDLVHQVMQATHTGRADVHAGPLANRLETLQNGDVLGVVVG